MSIRCRKRVGILVISRRLAVHLAAFLTIAGSQVAGCQRSNSAAADTSLLSAILKAAKSDAGKGDLRVDPRPLVADAGRYTVQPEAIAPVSPIIVRRRAAVIRAAGLRTADATRENQSKDCPGTLVIEHSDSLGRTNSHAGCPEEPYSILAVGLPRPGSKVLAGEEVYDRDVESAALGYWAARVIRTSLGPGGSSVHASDYVLARRAGSWVVIKTVGLMYVE